MFHLTDSPSNGEPSWYFTSLRSEKVTVLPSPDVSHFSASQGMILPLSSIQSHPFSP